MQLVNELCQIDWQTVFISHNDPSIMFDNFYTRISEIIDKHIPKKIIKTRIQTENYG